LKAVEEERERERERERKDMAHHPVLTFLALSSFFLILPSFF
jgi:hypothetical protein